MTSPPPHVTVTAAGETNLPQVTIVGYLKSTDALPLYLLIGMVFYVIMVNYCVHRFRQKPKPLKKKKKNLESLPKVVLTQDCVLRLCRCVICLEDYVVGDVVRLMPRCGHEFHVSCIDNWFQLGSTCPSCRSIPVLQ